MLAIRTALSLISFGAMLLAPGIAVLISGIGFTRRSCADDTRSGAGTIHRQPIIARRTPWRGIVFCKDSHLIDAVIKGVEFFSIFVDRNP